MMPLTPKERRCLDAIDRMTICSVPPSYRQLADALGAGLSATHNRVQQLVDKGYVRAGNGKSRSIQIIARPDLKSQLSGLIAVHGRDAVRAAFAQVVGA